MPRIEFTKKQKAQIVIRSRNDDGDICCEGCGLVLGMKPWEIDHTVPEGLRDHTMKRNLTASDGKLLGHCCHKPKTKTDVQQIRKADRQKNRQTGVTRPQGRMQGQGFAKASKTPKITKTPLPPRRLYAVIGK